MFKRTNSTKRVARRIGGDDSGASSTGGTSQGGAQNAQVDSAVTRPGAKVKKRSTLRLSFGRDEDADDGAADTALRTPKKTNLSRIARENNADRIGRSPLATELRAGADDDRPSYSKDYIAELRGATPSRPTKAETSGDDDEEASQALDIASKFGPLANITPNEPSAIPTQAEIQEKKARRARLAKENDAMELLGGDESEEDWADERGSDDEFRTGKNEILLRPKDKYAETRLTHEDEDMAEGFDEFTEDPGITFSKKAEKEAERQRRAEISAMINDAEGSSNDESDGSEAERNAAFEEAQTRAGTHRRKDKKEDDEDTKEPPKVSPLPDLADVLSRLQENVRAQEQHKTAMLAKLQELRDEQQCIAERQKFIQEQLQKTGEEYEKKRQEAGMAALPVNGIDGGKLVVNRGLDSLGTTPTTLTPRTGSEEDLDMDIDEEE